MQCPQCASQIDPYIVTCPHCMAHVGFPNVRAASNPDERQALAQRVAVARDDANRRGCEQQLRDFHATVANDSRAVINRRWGTLAGLAAANSSVFKTFYEMVNLNERRPQDNGADRARKSVDATFFPYYEDQIHFAALSLSGQGPASYGECSLVLHNTAIAHRASVFEENTLVFCRKHVIAVGQSPPCGYRATWLDRADLAIAKLHAEIQPGTVTDNFDDILLKQKGGTDQDEFLEVHVYGTLTFNNVERFRWPTPKIDDDRVLCKRFERAITGAGAISERR